MIPINENFPGQNAWMPATVPAGCDPLNGRLDEHWDDVEHSGVKFIRIGGKTYDKYFRVAADYAQFNIPGLIARGFTPIVQLSYYETPDQIWTVPGDAATYLLNNVVTDLYNQGARYFSIANESDTAEGYTNTVGVDQPYESTEQQIHAYISAISATIKSVYPDIKVLGPELSSLMQL